MGRVGWRHEQRSDRRWSILELVRQADAVRYRSGYGEVVSTIHDRTVRPIRDLPVLEHAVELRAWNH